jgi:hypothetical protein
MSKHTPGPWTIKFHGEDYEILGANGDLVYGCEEYYPSTISADDAILMAMALELDAENERLRAINAELVQALQAFLGYGNFDIAVGGNPIAVDEMLARARAALAKAEDR